MRVRSRARVQRHPDDSRIYLRDMPQSIYTSQGCGRGSDRRKETHLEDGRHGLIYGTQAIILVSSSGGAIEAFAPEMLQQLSGFFTFVIRQHAKVFPDERLTELPISVFSSKSSLSRLLGVRGHNCLFSEPLSGLGCAQGTGGVCTVVVVFSGAPTPYHDNLNRGVHTESEAIFALGTSWNKIVPWGAPPIGRTGNPTLLHWHVPS
ncbi:hypothetical protein EX30DRAFT_367170 [Ascodesmis nigricans]|uniref:Uncharacterized protein n=1 Tax=Ascodesmis nigricans TaxID=341454 RepID=A0A4S2MIJ2_9PEZI|nr:hypothetical protein EX30DRAFT_367170 [Ascodesmis nigricans]